MSAGPVNRPDTRDPVYTARLRAEGGVWWKRLLRVQAPYGWNLRRLEPGFTLDIGCGIGRNLAHLRGHGSGIDHNADSVAAARARGFEAFTPEEFRGSSYDRPGRFDSLLLSHVAEHMTHAQLIGTLRAHIGHLKPGGKVIFITPQERGYRSDPTHVRFLDFEDLREAAGETGLALVRESSFPFPRFAGRWFAYNEFVSVSVKPR